MVEQQSLTGSAAAGVRALTVNDTVAQDYFASSSVLDDLALAAAWLHRATGDPFYLGAAQQHLQQHLEREAWQGLAAEPRYFLANWDNAQWPAAALLAELTGQQQYHDLVREFLRAWQSSKVPAVLRPSDQDLLQQLAALRAEASTRALTTGAPTAPAAQLLRDVTTGATYIPLSAECTPAINATAAALVARNASASFLDRYVAFEQECSNGLDDDCDGLVDSEDPDCPFQPVAYTPQQLAWTPGEPLPSAAGAALLILAYARSAGAAGRLSGSQRRSLQCWALGQAYYMLGATGGQLRGGGG